MSTQVRVHPVEELKEEHQSVLKLLGEVNQTLQAADSKNPASWSASLDAACRYFRKEVAVHFKKEEDALFLAMERYFGQQGGPLVVMLKEHQEHYMMLDQLCTAVQNRDLSATRSVWQAFNPHLTTHIMKEDTVLFPMAERMLDATECMEISRKMGAINQAL